MYYNAVKIAKEIQLGFDTNAATRMNGLGVINSWVQAAEDNAVKEDNNIKDFKGASNIVYINQPMEIDFENLAVLSKLINNTKY